MKTNSAKAWFRRFGGFLVRECAPVSVQGNVTLLARIDAPGAEDDGRIIACHRNTITIDSRGIMAKALAGDNRISTVAWGSGITPPSRADTKLENELLVTATTVIDTVGKTVYRGTGVPGVSLGVDGDYYIDTTPTPHQLYGPKLAGVWGAGQALPAEGGMLDGETPILSPVAYPTEDSVLFASTLPPGIGTGKRFSEIGLKSTDGKLYARFTFPPQDKFDRLRLSVTWQIIFVR